MFYLNFDLYVVRDDEFGMNYVGSNLWRKNQRKRKQLAKQNRKH